MRSILQNLIIIILIINSILALLVFIFGILQAPDRRKTILIFSWFFFICPLVGFLFTGIGMVIDRLYRPGEVDLNEISFSKSREKAVLSPDSETELNYVPLSDARIVSDKKNVRNLLIDVLKNEELSVFPSIVNAVDDSDTEVSHYAASAVLDILSEYRVKSQQLLEDMRQHPEDVNNKIFTLEYFHSVLEMGIMNEREQESTIKAMNEVMESFFIHNLWYIKSEYYLWICKHLIRIKDFGQAEIWVKRARKYCPDELDTYKACLYVSFAKGDKDWYFECLQQLKYSDIVVDKEVLDLFRLFG